MAFTSVPRPGQGNIASSWLESLKEAGANTMSTVGKSEHMKAVSERASKLSEGVSDALKNSPASQITATISTKGEQIQGLITGQQKEPETAAEYVEEAMTMSYKNRLIAFVLCLASGVFFTALSTLMLPLIVIKPHKFAVAYSLGNMLMLGSTMFLVGPKKQLQNMFTGHRAMASAAYFGSMIGTIYAAIWLRISVLVIFFIAVQFCSLVWYSLSYIPFGRQLASRFLKPCMKVTGSCLTKCCGCLVSQVGPGLLPR